MNRRLVIMILLIAAAVAGYIAYRKIPPRPVSAQLDVIPLDSKLTIKLDPRGECGTGEVEAILAVAPRTAPLLLTIEPIDLSDNGFVPVSERIEPLLLKQPTQRTLEVPGRKRGTHAGIFICSDKKRTGRCADKNTVGFEALQSSAFVLKDIKQYEDQIFYFQYLFASRNGLQFLRPSADEEGARAAVRAALAANATPAQSAKALEERVMDWLVKVGSTTLVPEPKQTNPTLTIQMSQMDETLCPVRPKTIQKISPGSIKPAGSDAKSSRRTPGKVPVPPQKQGVKK